MGPYSKVVPMGMQSRTRHGVRSSKGDRSPAKCFSVGHIASEGSLITLMRAATGENVMLRSFLRRCDAKQSHVVLFLRHFGCPFSYELIQQVQEEWLPKFEELGVTVSAVGIGTREQAVEFAKALEFPTSAMFADTTASAYRELGFHRGLRRLYLAKESHQALSDARKRQRLALVATHKYRWGLVDTGTFLTQNAQQGGVVAVRNGTVIVVHRDPGTGAHAQLEDVLEALASDSSPL